MTMQTIQLPPSHDAQIYLSADGAFVLTVLPDGSALRLPRERYDHLARCTRSPWPRQAFAALYWALRFALLVAGWHGHL